MPRIWVFLHEQHARTAGLLALSPTFAQVAAYNEHSMHLGFFKTEHEDQTWMKSQMY